MDRPATDASVPVHAARLRGRNSSRNPRGHCWLLRCVAPFFICGARALHIGFSGAAAAVLIGVSPIYGLLLFTSAGGLGIAALGRRAANRDAEIGIVLAFMLGLGVLFLSLYTGYATEAYSILFGEILGVSFSNVLLTLVAGVVILVVISLVYRPLLFASLDEDVAEAKGMPIVLLGIIFMLLVAVATSFAVQVVGVLLIFSLMVTPAATAQLLAKRPGRVIIISVVIALIATWLGLFIAFFEPYPVSFFITTIVFVFYLFVRFITPRIRNFLSGFRGKHATSVVP